MKNKLFLCILLMATLLVASCSQEELCRQPNHPHTATVTFDFVWEDGEHRPDTMAVVAYRVVNNWKRMFNINSDTKRGFYLNTVTSTRAVADGTGTDDTSSDGTDTNTDGTDTNTDTGSDNTNTDNDGIDIEVEEQGTTDDGGETQKAGVTEETDKFEIRQGDYKFITVSGDKDAQDLSEIYDFANEEKSLRDICASYYDYDKTDPRLQSRLVGWTDYNQYARYIQPGVSPINYDTVSIVKVSEGQHITCTFHPKPVTQNVDVYFTVTKDIQSIPFVVDSVWAEISGVPRSVSLANGHLDITRTAKMMFPMEMTPGGATEVAADSYDNTVLKCHANIDVTGIVNVQQLEGETLDIVKKKTYGPGIMQVIIFTHSKELNSEGNHKAKKVQGVINLYNSLQKANLISISEDGRYATRRTPHGTLNINADLLISGESIVNNNDDTGGIDRWRTPDPGQDNIEIEI